MAGVALVAPTEEQRLRQRIAELEHERDRWQEEAVAYQGYWVAMCRQNDEKLQRICELTAALSRLGLRMTV
jgi:hypothetical protein